MYFNIYPLTLTLFIFNKHAIILKIELGTLAAQLPFLSALLFLISTSSLKFLVRQFPGGLEHCLPSLKAIRVVARTAVICPQETLDMIGPIDSHRRSGRGGSLGSRLRLQPLFPAPAAHLCVTLFQLPVVPRGASVYRADVSWQGTSSVQIWEVIIHSWKKLFNAAPIWGSLVLQ